MEKSSRTIKVHPIHHKDDDEMPIYKTEVPMHVADKKIYFAEQNFWQFKYKGELLPEIKPDANLKSGMSVSRYPMHREFVTVNYQGGLQVSLDQKVTKEQAISKYGKILKKEITSPVSGTVVKIDDKNMKITIEVPPEPSENEEIFVPTAAPFDCVVNQAMKDNTLLLEFSAVNINFFELKGQDAVGKIRYIPSAILEDKDKRPERLEDTILITDTITSEMYPHLSAMDVSGLILNHIEYSLYAEIITLLMPIAIISGFGKLHEDDKLIKYFKSKEGSTGIIDATFNRLMILDDKKTPWASYHFDLDKIGITGK